MEELLKDFREWDKKWELYDLYLSSNSKEKIVKKPQSIEQFQITLSKKYKIKKLNEVN